MCRACEDARGLSLVFGQPLVVDAIDAKRALFHRARALIELARAVGARPRTEVAAHAFVLVDEHDAVAALVRRAGGTHADAGGFLAMQARHREVDRLRVRMRTYLVVPDAVEPDAGGLCAVGVVIGEWAANRRCAVPFLARRCARVAAHARVEIDHQTELHVRVGRRHSGQRITAGRATPAASASGGAQGAVPCSPLSHFVRRTRTSNHAAWPVIGSELVMRRPSSPRFGKCSQIR